MALGVSREHLFPKIMKKLATLLIAFVIATCAWGQDRPNTPPDPSTEKPMSEEMKAYIAHLSGISNSAATKRWAPRRKASSATWSYPSYAPSVLFGGGSGTSSNPYIISTAQHLANLAYMVNNGSSYSGCYFKMTEDIILNDNVLNSDGSLNSGSYNSWKPIGNSSYAFRGTFDGDGHVISGIYINNSSSNYQGLFGNAYDGLITNISVIDSYIYGYNYVGTIVGFSGYASITKCFSSATVIGRFDVGGINGDVMGSGSGLSRSKSSSVITACVNYGKVTGSLNCTGGISGYCSSSVNVSYCINAGMIYNYDGY